MARRQRRTGQFRDKLVALREATGREPIDIAIVVGIGETGYRHWEQGRSEPSIADLPALAKAFGLTLHQLVDALFSEEFLEIPAALQFGRALLEREEQHDEKLVRQIDERLDAKLEAFRERILRDLRDRGEQ